MQTTRRHVLTGATAATFLLALADARPAHAVGADQQRFLDISRAVTGRPDLDPRLADQMLQAMRATWPGYDATLALLADATTGGGTPEAILARIGARQDAADAMHQLVAAWYMGTAKNVMHADMVSYYDALMYRPTRDALPVPTYCYAEPAWWTQDPPPLGIAAVAPKPVAPPAPPPVAVETRPPPTARVEPHHRAPQPRRPQPQER